MIEQLSYRKIRGSKILLSKVECMLNTENVDDNENLIEISVTLS